MTWVNRVFAVTTAQCACVLSTLSLRNFGALYYAAFDPFVTVNMNRGLKACMWVPLQFIA